MKIPETSDPRVADVSAQAAALILSFEGMDQPARWPGGSSGITLGHGFDLGYATAAQFKEAWERHLKPEHYRKLLTAIGKTGQAAKAIAGRFKGIILTQAEANDVFWRCTMPRWRRLTAETFPGIKDLTATQEGVLVSVCFNRGTSMTGDRRKEMRAIRDILKRKDLTPQRKALLIADQIEAMQRIWPTNGGVDPGLRRRRRAEAALMRAEATVSALPSAA